MFCNHVLSSCTGLTASVELGFARRPGSCGPDFEAAPVDTACERSHGPCPAARSPRLRPCSTGSSLNVRCRRIRALGHSISLGPDGCMDYTDGSVKLAVSWALGILLTGPAFCLPTEQGNGMLCVTHRPLSQSPVPIIMAGAATPRRPESLVRAGGAAPRCAAPRAAIGQADAADTAPSRGPRGRRSQAAPPQPRRAQSSSSRSSDAAPLESAERRIRRITYVQ
jgi:hypothetical protein